MSQWSTRDHETSSHETEIETETDYYETKTETETKKVVSRP